MSDLRSSRTTMSSGTANDAWSLSAWTSVARYPSASSARANASVRKATVTAAAPGPRPSVTAARRAPTLRWSERGRPAGRAGRRAAPPRPRPRRRSGPGRRSRTRPAFWLSASRDWSAAPPSKAATTSAIEPTAATSSSAEAALVAGRHRGRDGDDQRREHDDARRDREPGRREDALTEHGAHGRTGAARRQRADRDADEPADHAPRPRRRSALSVTVRSRSCQRRAPYQVSRRLRRLEIAPHAPRREHGEGEEEGRRLAADEQQPPPGDGGRRAPSREAPRPAPGR